VDNKIGLMITTRDIAEGEELSIDYGSDHDIQESYENAIRTYQQEEDDRMDYEMGKIRTVMNVVGRMAKAVSRGELKTTVWDEEGGDGIRFEEQAHHMIATYLAEENEEQALNLKIWEVYLLVWDQVKGN
jgi:hypothetical protein